MVAASMGLPETFFGDVSVGTLATAKSLDRPTELQMVDRQSLWADVIGAILDYVVEQSVRAGNGLLKGTVEEDEDGTPIVTLAGEMDPTIEVVFPPVLEHDVKESVDALVQAATLGGAGVNAGIIPQWRELSRMLLTALGERDVEGLLDLMFPEDEVAPTAPAVTEANSVANKLFREASKAARKAGLGAIVSETEVALARIFREAGEDPSGRAPEEGTD